jgi:hypothetical protein
MINDKCQMTREIGSGYREIPVFRGEKNPINELSRLHLRFD